MKVISCITLHDNDISWFLVECLINNCHIHAPEFCSLILFFVLIIRFFCWLLRLLFIYFFCVCGFSSKLGCMRACNVIESIKYRPNCLFSFVLNIEITLSQYQISLIFFLALHLDSISLFCTINAYKTNKRIYYKTITCLLRDVGFLQPVICYETLSFTLMIGL